MGVKRISQVLGVNLNPPPLPSRNLSSGVTTYIKCPPAVQTLAQSCIGAQGRSTSWEALEVLLLHGLKEKAAGAWPEKQRQSEHTSAGVQTAGVSCSPCLQSLKVNGRPQEESK